MSPVEWLEHHFQHQTDEYLNRFRRPSSRGIVEFQPMMSKKARWRWKSALTPCVPCWLRTGHILPFTVTHAAGWHEAAANR